MRSGSLHSTVHHFDSTLPVFVRSVSRGLLTTVRAMLYVAMPTARAVAEFACEIRGMTRANAVLTNREFVADIACSKAVVRNTTGTLQVLLGREREGSRSVALGTDVRHTLVLSSSG